MLAKRHDTIAVVVNDRAEVELPDLGMIEVEDAETGEIMTVDTSSLSFRRDYKKLMLQKQERRDAELKRARVERIDVVTDRDIVDPLIKFFQRRNRK
jgi:uncharacterized protein (DUF58 family)